MTLAATIIYSLCRFKATASMIYYYRAPGVPITLMPYSLSTWLLLMSQALPICVVAAAAAAAAVNAAAAAAGAAAGAGGAGGRRHRSAAQRGAGAVRALPPRTWGPGGSAAPLRAGVCGDGVKHVLLLLGREGFVLARWFEGRKGHCHNALGDLAAAQHH